MTRILDELRRTGLGHDAIDEPRVRKMGLGHDAIDEPRVRKTGNIKERD
jgi:hypothetical protein